MAVGAANNGTEQAAAAASASARPPAVLLDPELLMAARCGNSRRLKQLLLLNDDEEEEQAAVSDAVILELAPRRRPPAPASAAAALAPAPAPPGCSGPAPLRPPPPPLVDGVTMEGDSLLHVVAACGDDENFVEFARNIVRAKKHKGGAAAVRLALEARNNKGDTPLHCAAGAGNAHMISCLVGLLANTADEATAAAKFLRTQNECRETALHQAIRAPENKQVTCVDQLMAVDPELAYIPHEEDATSPLYLAISLGELRIARHLHVKTKGKLSYFGADGRNVLHAAVSDDHALRMVLEEWLMKREPTTTVDNDDMPQQESQGVAHRLLSHLTNQRDKENGSTPLHLAASLGGLPSPFRPRKTHPHFWKWSGSPGLLLLDANKSTAYQPDKTGMYPIHVAAGSGCLGVMKMMLLGKCPECATLRDAKERTFLHVVVEEGRVREVKYVCRQSQLHRQSTEGTWLLSFILNAHRQSPAGVGLLSSILNAQDINGDTALHRAVHSGNWAIFFSLVCNQRVRLDVTNKEGMTPIDVAWSKMPSKVYYAWDSRIHIRKYLLSVGAPYGESRGGLFHQKYVLPKQDEVSANLTAAVQALGLFSVLMTTVTFASAFTLPGGYRSAGDGGGGVAGTPVAGRSYAFDAFVLSNTLAFISSLYATSVLLYAGVPGVGTLHGRFRLINRAYTMMWHAGRSLVAAFALGLYVVLLPDDRTVAIAVVVLMIIIAIRFLKDSEGINSTIVIGRNRILSTWDFLLLFFIYALDHFWSYIIIFGLPAIRKWARLP